MGTPISIDKAIKQLTLCRDDKANEMWKLWPLLPAGLSEPLVRAAMKRVLGSEHGIGVIGRSLPIEYHAPFFSLLEGRPKWPLAVAARSVEHVPDADRREVLGEVLRQVGQLGVFSASVSQLQARARAFSKDPHLVEAARQIVLTASFDEMRTYHRLMLVSVLMEDGSDASLDVLIAEAHRALAGAPEEVDQLRECMRWRKPPKPALSPLIAMLERTVSRAGGDEALPALAKHIGLGRAPRVLTASFSGHVQAKGGALSLRVELDTSARRWWWVELRRGRGKPVVTVELSPQGRTGNWAKAPALADFTEYPAWLAAVKALVGVQAFSATWLGRSSLRGKDRARLEAWLAGGTVPAPIVGRPPPKTRRRR